MGDFGIAFITNKTCTMREPIGTHDYMAPEIIREKIYNRTADLYSLGLIMYRILNQGRAPFIPPETITVTKELIKEANIRRMNGEALPKLRGVPDKLENIVLKACSHLPSNRYQTAEQMKNALIEYMRIAQAEETVKKKACMNLYFTAAGELE